MDVRNKTNKLSYIQNILTCTEFDSIVDFSKWVPLDNVLQRIRDNIDRYTTCANT